MSELSLTVYQFHIGKGPMKSNMLTNQGQQQVAQPKIQIYPASNGEISPFWREKYEKDANKYWDIFYKRHQDKFFKDRHYLDKEWGHYFSGGGRKVILEVGCGSGNTLFPLIAIYPDIFVHACDFSPRAVNLVKMHKEFKEACVNAFVCDLTADDLSEKISPSSVDIVTMIFVLSAVSPEKMSLVLQNIRKVLKPDGIVLFRDYATGDLAQERFTSKDQKISENFYVRGDGTRAFYFSDECLSNIFHENGFDTKEHIVCCKEVENRSREIIMKRRWVQAVFCNSSHGSSSSTKMDTVKPQVKNITPKLPTNALDIDISEGVAAEMFGIVSSSEEIIEVSLGVHHFKIKLLCKEYQHTCKSTGMMLWESARLMANVVAENESIVAGKKVLELGCGSGGIVSMIASKTANLVVASDGDAKSLDVLKQNVASNLEPSSHAKLIVNKLEWGNKDDIEATKQVSNGGFEVIIGTDVTYVSEAIIPLFETARELIAVNEGGGGSALILCHVLRRVDEPSILAAAARFGFRLVDRWPEEKTCVSGGSCESIIATWFSNHCQEDSFPTTALTILYFTV